MNCLNCGKKTSNPKYCSRSCSATVTSRLYPKRKPEGKCKICKEPISNARTYCSECFKRPDITLGQLTYKHLHKSSAFALIRSRARTVCKDRPQECAWCGYNKHVQVCHIKAISDFSDAALVSEVNAPDNLLLLCPNHHWEFDHPER